MAETFLHSSVILRTKQLSKFLGLSRSAIYDRLNPESPRYDSTFPTQIHLGGRSVGFLEAEVNEWLKARIEARERRFVDTILAPKS